MKDIKYCGLTEEQFKRFKNACWSTYQSIGMDLGGARSQRDQIEVICDADYIGMYGERSKDWKDFYRATIRPMFDAHYDSKEFWKMMKEVFPHKRYE